MSVRAIRQELGHLPPDGTKRAQISDVASFSAVSVLSFDPIRVRALSIEEPQLGCISSATVLAVCVTHIVNVIVEHHVAYAVCLKLWLLNHIALGT